VEAAATPRRGPGDGDRGAAAHLRGFRTRTPGAHPQLSPGERQRLRAFLQRQQEAEGAGTTEFLLGHHSFFYGAPNALARVLLPLFKRIEDFSVYPRESQVGLPADLLDYDIDNPEPVTLHYPRQ
jgi:hypothetical protein